MLKVAVFFALPCDIVNEIKNVFYNKFVLSLREAIQLPVLLHMRLCSHTHTHTYTHARTDTDTDTYTHKHARTQTHTRIFVHKSTKVLCLPTKINGNEFFEFEKSCHNANHCFKDQR